MNAVGNTALTILEFVLAFGALIFLHEFGHFIFARLSKIEVEEFGIGYPPKIVRLFRAGGRGRAGGGAEPPPHRHSRPARAPPGGGGRAARPPHRQRLPG